MSEEELQESPRPVHLAQGGARNADADCLSLSASPKDLFDLLAARKTASTEDLFSVEDPFSVYDNYYEIRSLLAHCAISGKRPFELLA